jgi:hypothetical protein
MFVEVLPAWPGTVTVIAVFVAFAGTQGWKVCDVGVFCTAAPAAKV